MSRYEDLKKKRAEGSVQSQPTSRYEKLKASRTPRAYGVDDAYVSSFIRDSQDFFSRSKSEWDSINWTTATDKSRGESRSAEAKGLQQRADAIRAYLNSNKATIDTKAYRDMLNYLDDYASGSKDVLQAFTSASDLYSQFKSQEDYDTAVRNNGYYQKYSGKTSSDLAKAMDLLDNGEEKSWLYQYQQDVYADEMGKYDIDTAQKKVDTLQRVLSEYDKLQDYYNRSQQGTLDAASQSLADTYLQYQEKFGSKEDLKKQISDLKRDINNAKTAQNVNGVLSGYIKSPESATGGKDFLRVLHGTLSDVGANVNTAVLDATEALVDTAAYGIGWLGGDEFKKKTGDFISQDLLDHINQRYLGGSPGEVDTQKAGEFIQAWSPLLTGDIITPALIGRDIEGYSVLDDKADSLVQSGAHMIGSQALEKFAKVPSWLTMGVNAFGGELEEAFRNDATYGQAGISGGISAAAEAITEKLGGGEFFGGKSAASFISNLVTQKMGDSIWRHLIRLGIDSSFEGLEEIFSGIGSAIGKKATYMSEKELSEIFSFQDALDSFIGGAIIGFLGGGTGIVREGVANKPINQEYKRIYGDPEVLKDLVDTGLSFGKKTDSFKTAKVIESRQSKGKDVKGADIRALVEANTAEVKKEAFNQAKEDAKKRLEELGEKKDIDKLAEIAAKRATGQELTRSEISTMKRSKSGRQVAKELRDSNEYSTETTLALPKAKKTETNVPDTVTVSENAARVSHEISDDGASINLKTGDTIELDGLTQADDGSYMVAVKGAEPLHTAEVSYSNSNQAIAYEAFANLAEHSTGSKSVSDMSLRDRNALLGLLDPNSKQDGGEFVNGILDAYFYGRNGVDLSSVGMDSPVWNLTEQQRAAAWDIGRKTGDEAVAKAQGGLETVYREAQKALSTGKAKKIDSGITLDDGITKENLNEKQSAVYEYATEIAHGIQTKIHIYDGKNSAMGFYNHATDEIWLNLNAASSGREAVFAFTLGHELGHRAKKGSPAKYRAFVDFLMKEYGKQGTDIEELIAEQMDAAAKFNRNVPKDQQVNMTREKALEEVVCDACQRMLLDTNAGKKLAEFGAQSSQNRSIVQDIKKWLSDLIGKLRNYFRNSEPDSKAAREFAKFDGRVKKILADMYVDMTLDAGEKLSTIKAAYGESFADKFLGLKDIQYNLAAEKSHRAKLAKEFSKDSASDLQTITARYDKIIDIWQRLGGELNSKFLNEWNSKVGKDRTFTIFKAQAGYKYNVELSSMCKKGVPLFEAIDTIVKQEVMKELGTKVLGKPEKEILYDILKQHNFEIPCAICYVEQARQREGVIIDAFINGKVEKNSQGEITKLKLGWNEVLDSIQEDMKANGVDYRFPQVSRDIATDKYSPADLVMDKKTQAAFYAALQKLANQEIARYNKAEGKSRKLLREVTPQAVKECFKGTLPSNLKIFKVLFEEPSSRFKIQSDLLYSSIATQNLSMAHNKLYGLFNSQGGVSGYKTKQGTTIYWGDILGKSWRPDTLRNEGGVRNQSNSDFQMYTLLDQAQMYIDFTAKGYYLQAYTKVLGELKLFGLSRGKINASLIPKVVVYRNADGSVDVEKTMATAGLDENGNPIYDDVEGINHREAFMLIGDPEYSKNICGICIGYSDAHIRKLLDDSRVQMIIGFHDKTDDGSKRYKGARYAKNYNGLNEAVNKDGKAVHIGFNPYVKKAENKFQFNAKTETFEGTVDYNGKTYTADDIPKLAADLYLEMCDKKGYTPAYQDFVDHPNYYKLLADFGLYDSQGHYAPHRKVVYNMPDTVPYLDANGKKQNVKTYDYIKAELQKELTVRDSISEALADTSSEGIIPQFKAAVKKSQEEKSYSLPKLEAIKPSDEQLKQNVREIANMGPVHSVDASKLDKTGKRPSDIFTEQFDSWGWNIHSEDLGDVEITPQSVRDEVRHGITAVKIASVEAIPSVVQQGRIIFADLKPGTTVYRIVICAPITIGGNSYYMGVMLQRDANTQRLYLHNVVIEKETPTFSPADLLTTGANENNERLFITNILQAALKVKWQIQLDKEYLDAVNRGDTETAQRMVDEAAQNAGYTIKGYHGTDAYFNEFKIGDIGYHIGTKGQAESRIKDVGVVSEETGRKPHIMELYAKIENPLYAAFDFGDWHGKNVAEMLIETEQWEEGYHEGAAEINARLEEIAAMPNSTDTDRILREYLESLGYDGVVYDNQFEDISNDITEYSSGESFIVFNSNQLKYSDAVTYDDNGNVIPLSQRFNPKNDDIRYSLPKVKASPTYEELVSKDSIVVIDIGRNDAGLSYADLRDMVLRHARERKVFDAPHINRDTGVSIFLTMESFTHAFHNPKANFGVDTILAMDRITEIIHEAVLTHIDPPKNPARAEKRVFTFFAAIDGENGIEPIKLKVKEYIEQQLDRLPENIRKYFEGNGVSETHNRLYDAVALEVVAVESAKKESGASASGTNREERLAAKGTPNSTIKIADLLGLVNGNARKYIPIPAADAAGNHAGDFGKVDYKLPIGEDTSPRALLANAFEGIITNDIEKQKIREYKSKAEMLDTQEKKLRELRAQIKELSFAKGKRDTKKIKALQDEATKTANRIAILDKMLFRLEASKPLQNILEREKAMAYKRAEMKGKEALRAYREAERERDRQWQSQVRDKYQASRKKAIETREKREAREKLQKLVLDTVKWISYPSKTDVKCPDILKKPYADFLNSIDMSSQRLASGGDPTKSDLRLANAMSSLATALDKVMASQDPTQDTASVLDTGYLDLPASFVENLRDMTEDIKAMTGEGDYVVNSMSAAEVRKLSQMIRTLNHAIREVSTLYSNLRFANVEALGDNTITFMDDLGEVKKTATIKDFVEWDNALPYYAFKRFGIGGESVFEGLMDAQDKLAFLAKTIFEFRDKTWTPKEANAWSKDTHSLELPNGNTLTLTTADAMSIYCLSRRQQGLQHLLGGGTRVIGLTKGSQKAQDSRSVLTVKDIDFIISSLTDRQKQVAEAIQEFMSTVCSDWGNEISMKRFLTKEFNEKFYFPIESNDENLATKDPTAQQSDLFRLLNISATKPIDPRANNEVIIRNIFDVFTGHASDMARLNAFGMPLLDYMKWLNYREKSVNEDGQITVRGVRKSMERAYGAAAKSYVLNLVKDVNGRPSDGGEPSILTKWMRAAKTASVGSSLRVATLQITSYPRAALVLSPKSLTLGLSKKPQIEKAKKYCGIALWKSYGFYDTNIARSIEDQIKGVKDIKQKLIEMSLKGAEIGDAITWGCLWNACEYEVAATKKYKVGTEEFNQAVARKLREVVYRTQVVDSTLTRSQIMRSKRGMAQEAAAFMSEPTLSANILMDAGFQFNAEKRRTGSAKLAWKKTRKYVTRSVSVYSVGQLAAALLEGLWDAWRDEEDEEFGAKYLSSFVENLALDLAPFNKVPIISDVFEAALAMFNVGYYSSDRMSSTWLTQAVSAVDTWKDVITGDSSATVYNAIYKTSRALSSFFGVSGSGVMREGVALWNNTAGAYDITLKVRTWKMSDSDIANEALDALLDGNERQAKSLKEEFADVEDYKKAMRSAIKDRYISGDIDEETAKKYLVGHGGWDTEESSAKIRYWDFKQDNPNSDLSQGRVEDYNQYAKPAGIALDLYEEYVAKTKNIETKYDSKGDVVKTAKEQVLAVINSLPITRAQKDALYLAEGYAKSKLDEAPWR